MYSVAALLCKYLFILVVGADYNTVNPRSASSLDSVDSAVMYCMCNYSARPTTVHTYAYIL